MKNNKILSIQSKLIYGYVGSNIAELAIQLHGLDVISFPTVLLATHTGHKPIFGRAISVELFDELIKGIKNIHVIDSVACMLTGYIGSEEVLRSSSEFIKEIKQKHPDKIYICDPVMGDKDTGFYVPENVAGMINDLLLPHCDVLTPNQFEAEYILNHEIKSVEELQKAVANHSLVREKTMVITSCILEDTPSDKIETIIIQNQNIKRIHLEKVDLETTGTGDFYTATLASLLAKGESIESAVAHSSKTTTAIMKDVLEKGLREINAELVLKYSKN